MSLRRIVAGSTAVAIACALVTGCGGSTNASSGGKSYVIRFTSPDPKGEPQADQLTHFADLIKKDAQGKISVKTYFNGVLANAAGGVKLVANGSAQMTYSNAPSVAAYVPGYNFLQMPLLFTDRAKIAKGLASPAVAGLDSQLLKKTGLRVLAWGALGFVDLLNRKRPITSAQDMKGLRFRVIPGSAPVTAAMKALGAQPVPLDITEVYTALEQGTIDGNIDPATTFYPSKQYEVAKYLSVMPFQYNPMPLLINDKFFNSLPSDLQTVVQKDAAETATWEIAQQEQQASRDISLMRQKGTHVNTVDAAGVASFVKALGGARSDAYKKFGADLFKAFEIAP